MFGVTFLVRTIFMAHNFYVPGIFVYLTRYFVCLITLNERWFYLLDRGFSETVPTSLVTFAIIIIILAYYTSHIPLLGTGLLPEREGLGTLHIPLKYFTGFLLMFSSP